MLQGCKIVWLNSARLLRFCKKCYRIRNVKNRKIILPLIIATLSIPLLGMLAWNQFNWLQELQKREKKRIEYSMIYSARTLSKRLKEEILFLPSLLRFRKEQKENLEQIILERYAFWTYYAINPKIIASLYIKEEEGKFIGEKIKETHFIPVSSEMKIEQDLQIAIPLWSNSPDHNQIIFVYDRPTLYSQVIPTIAQETIDNTDLFVYRIIDTHTNTLLYISDNLLTEDSFLRPDIEIPLLERARIPAFQPSSFLQEKVAPEDLFNTFSFIKDRNLTENEFPDEIKPEVFLSGLRLQIVYKKGSLQSLSQKTTIQNAMLSAGILFLLILIMITLAEATRRSRKLATSQREFIATITHELKTPLAVISAAAQNLSDGLITDRQKAEQYGQMIRKESLRLGSSIEHFLLYSNTQSLSRIKNSPCNVRDLIETALKFTEEDRKALEFRTEIIMSETPLFIEGDKVALEAVFQNLVQNVIRHAASGKYLGIYVTISEEIKKVPVKHIILKVRDKGPGIPAKEQKLIFEPFVRGASAVKEQIPGNGIGLNLIRRIIQMHGGTITLESRPGIGSTFTIILPVGRGDRDV